MTRKTLSGPWNLYPNSLPHAKNKKKLRSLECIYVDVRCEMTLSFSQTPVCWTNANELSVGCIY